jgi:DNA ligase-1
MEFADFAARADEIAAEPADLEITALVRTLLRDAGDDLPIVARFVQGRVFPAWDSTTLDVGPSLCHEAIARAAGPNVDAADVEERLADVGEIGDVAAGYDFGGQRGLAAFGAGGDDREALTVAGVEETLRDLAGAEGAGSEDRKRDLLFGLFNRAESVEARYLARLVLSEMRIGVGAGTVRDAVAAAFDVPVDSVARALQVTNDYGRVAELAREEGVAGLDEVRLEVGRPVQAMLAQAGTVTDALEAWEEVAVETKFDGARVQVHYDGDEVHLFSRNMEDVTDPLPEIVEFVEERVSPPVILDGEVVAVDGDGSPRPFQEVLRRFRRKYDVDRMREEVELDLRVFDCLHADGEDLLEESLLARHERLRGVVDDDRAVADLLHTGDVEAIESCEAEALAAGHEGIMLKNPNAAYTPGKRGKNWLKRKPDVETLDLVVTGAEWGEGRRANRLGTFLLSARAGEDGDYETIGKVATGITDERLAELTDLLEPEIVSQDGTDVEIRPSIVFEVGYEEIQRSPTYSSGYALRFPRFVAVRDDVAPEDADTLERVERLAESQ